MLLGVKKRKKRTEPRTRLDSTQGKKNNNNKKKQSCKGKIKLDRTGSATRSEQNLLPKIQLRYKSSVISRWQANF
jgi:hypothetical protein